MKIIIAVLNSMCCLLSVYGAEDPYGQLLSPSSKDREASAISIAQKPDIISTSNFPALLDALDNMHPQDRKTGEILIQFIAEGHWPILAKDPQAVKNAPKELKDHIFRTCRKLVTQDNSKFKRFGYLLIGLYGKYRPEEERYLNERYSSEITDENKGWVLEGLGYTGIHLPETISTFKGAFAVKSSELIKHAIKGAAISKSPDVLPFIISALSQSDHIIQNEAINGIIRYNSAAKCGVSQMKLVLERLPKDSVVAVQLKSIIDNLLAQ